jgi:diadenosine tetraphosphate (Ap4A) HIT family hydrolase
MATSVEGWLILTLDRHAEAVADLTQPEAVELGAALREVSQALGQALGVRKTYVAQFAEHPDYRHVHVHVVARPVVLAPEHVGPGIFARLNEQDPTNQVSEARKNEIATEVRRGLAGSLTFR